MGGIISHFEETEQICGVFKGCIKCGGEKIGIWGYRIGFRRRGWKVGRV